MADQEVAVRNLARQQTRVRPRKKIALLFASSYYSDKCAYLNDDGRTPIAKHILGVEWIANVQLTAPFHGDRVYAQHF